MGLRPRSDTAENIRYFKYSRMLAEIESDWCIHNYWKDSLLYLFSGASLLLWKCGVLKGDTAFDIGNCQGLGVGM